MRTNVFKMLAACILLLMSLSVRAQAIEPSETLTEITKSDNCKVYSLTAKVKMGKYGLELYQKGKERIRVLEEDWRFWGTRGGATRRLRSRVGDESSGVRGRQIC